MQRALAAPAGHQDPALWFGNSPGGLLVRDCGVVGKRRHYDGRLPDVLLAEALRRVHDWPHRFAVLEIEAVDGTRAVVDTRTRSFTAT